MIVGEKDVGNLLNIFERGRTMDDFGSLFGEANLAKASGGILLMLGKNLSKLIRHDEGEIFEVIFEGLVGLVEPELVKFVNASFGGVEPDGVAFGLAKFATGNFVDNERARIAVSGGVFEALDEMDAGSAVAVLVGAAELEVDVVAAEEMKKIVALDEGVAKFGVADAGTAVADAFLDELTIEQLSHTKGFADFTEERQKFDVAEPIVVIENLGVGGGMGDTNDLSGESAFVMLNFVEAFKVTLGSILRVANLASSAANEIIRSITVTNEASAHHEGGEMADMERIGGRVGTPIEIARSFV